MWRAGALLATVIGLLLVCTAVQAQYLPSTPLTLAGGRVVFGADVQAGIAAQDDEAWFNYTDYEHDALRMLRWSVSGEWRIAPRFAFLGELRGENIDHPYASAAYLRVRPSARVPLDIQAGRIPPTFGSFGRRLYSSDNPLIGYPLAYQYLLAIRPDALPANADELLRMKARGWQSSFSIGSPVPAPGLPVTNGFRWDTGVQVRVGTDQVQGAVSLTNGSLCDPRVGDNNGGKQISGRFQLQPLFGLVIGISGARGAWLDRDVQNLVDPGARDARQRALGFDAEYSRGHWLVRGEAIRSAWELPSSVASSGWMDLVSSSGWMEGRYRLTPRVYVAGRADHLTFSRIRSSVTGSDEQWEAPVTRVEAAVGFYLQRNVVARLGVQRNVRDGGRVRERTFVATQVVFWF